MRCTLLVSFLAVASVGAREPSLCVVRPASRLRGGLSLPKLGGNALSAKAKAAAAAAEAEEEVRRRAAVKKAADRIQSRLFVALASMLFCGLLSYQLLQNVKDTILVDACGAEAITFIKVYGVLPASMVFVSVQSQMRRTGPDGRPTSFAYVAVAVPFLLFFVLFAAVLYPLRDKLHPETLPDLPSVLGTLTHAKALRSIQLLIRNWTFSLNYIMSELYGNVCVAILFWQFSNQVVSLRQGRLFYPLLARYTWIAPLLAGQVLVITDKIFHRNFLNSLRFVTGLVLVSGCVMIYMHRVALDASRRLAQIRPEPMDPAITGGNIGRRRRKKRAPGLFESLLVIAHSPYLLCIATLVLSYGFCMNFTEVTWKTMVRRCHPDLASYQKFQGWFSTALGLAVFTMSVAAPVITRMCGWHISALIVPMVMAALALPLYASAFHTTGDACERIAVIAGSVHNLASKSLKFTLFDPTKNMAYLPLPDDVRGKGQAAIDVLGSRIGKSGAALLQQLVIVCAGGEIIAGVPAIACMYAVATVAWITAVNALAHRLPPKMLKRGQDIN